MPNNRHGVTLNGKQLSWLLFGCLIICSIAFGLLAEGLRSAP